MVEAECTCVETATQRTLDRACPVHGDVAEQARIDRARGATRERRGRPMTADALTEAERYLRSATAALLARLDSHTYGPADLDLAERISAWYLPKARPEQERSREADRIMAEYDRMRAIVQAATAYVDQLTGSNRVGPDAQQREARLKVALIRAVKADHVRPQKRGDQR
jgi:hypothetical protein